MGQQPLKSLTLPSHTAGVKVQLPAEISLQCVWMCLLKALIAAESVYDIP